jgi:hypothetical protein
MPGILIHRELDGALGLRDLARVALSEWRLSKNTGRMLTELSRQSVFGRLAGYLITVDLRWGVTDADRLAHDPAKRAEGVGSSCRLGSVPRWSATGVRGFYHRRGGGTTRPEKFCVRSSCSARRPRPDVEDHHPGWPRILGGGRAPRMRGCGLQDPPFEET